VEGVLEAAKLFQQQIPTSDSRLSTPDSSLFGEVEMTLIDVVVLLIIAGICGALGQAISGFSRGGCLVSIALGFVGAVLGMWLARVMGLPEIFAVQIGTTSFPIVWSIIGSALFVAVVGLLTRQRP